MFRSPSRFLIFFIFSLSVLSGFGSNFLINKIKVKDKKKFSNIIKLLILFSILAFAIFLFTNFKKDYILSFGKNILENRYQALLSAGGPLKPLEYYLNKIDNAYNHLLNGLFIFFLLLVTSTSLLVARVRKVNLKHFKILIILLIFIDLAYFGMKYIDVIEPEEAFPKTDIIKFFEEDNSRYRILDMNETYTMFRATRYEFEDIWAITGKRIGTYNNFIDLIGDRLSEVKDKPEPIQNISYTKLLNLLNVKYVVTNEQLQLNDFEVVYINTTTNINVYKNNNYLPRAFIIPNAKVLTLEQEIFDELKSDSFNPKQYIILEEDPNVPLNNTSAYKEVGITYYSPNKITVSTNLENPGFLVLSEVWYPGWKAYDNNQELEIYKTDYTLRSIYLEKGDHIVEFVYDPDSFKYGLWITLVSLSSIFFLFLFQKLKYKR